MQSVLDPDSVVPLRASDPPPDHYYARNLLAVVTTVLDQYRDLLTEIELDYANTLFRLSDDAIRLRARIACRKGPVYFVDSMKYAEIDDLDSAISELQTNEIVELVPSIPGDSILERLSRKQLSEVFPLVKPRTPKSQYVNTIACRYSERRIREVVAQHRSWFILADQTLLDFFQLLFFGDRYSDLSSFVVRDLGIVNYENYELKPDDRLFHSRDELDTYLEWCAASESLALAEEEGNLGRSLAQSILEVLDRTTVNRVLIRYRDRILNRLGRELERKGQHRLAMRAYRRSTRHPARERIVRVLHRSKKRRWARQLQQTIISSPWNIEELQFAQRFGTRKKVEDRYQIDQHILEEDPESSIEEYALHKLTELGGNGWHLENAFPMSLFGLAYWDWMFVSVPGAFTNPFQVGPTDLYWPEFMADRKTLCKDPLDQSESVIGVVLKTYAAKINIANPLVSWALLPERALRTIVAAIGEDDLRKLLRLVGSDLQQMRSGFPDLTLIDSSGSYEFVEVKGLGDRVQKNQRIWLNALAEAKLPVRVLQFVEPP